MLSLVLLLGIALAAIDCPDGTTVKQLILGKHYAPNVSDANETCTFSPVEDFGVNATWPSLDDPSLNVSKPPLCQNFNKTYRQCCPKGTRAALASVYNQDRKQWENLTECLLCPAGRYSDVYHAYQLDLDNIALSWHPASPDPCTICPHGKYSDRGSFAGVPVPPTHENRTKCFDCPEHYHTTKNASVRQSACKICPLGEFYLFPDMCFSCYPNYFCPNGHDLINCSAGFISEARAQVCYPPPRITFETVVNPVGLDVPCTTFQERADQGCRNAGGVNQWRCNNLRVEMQQVRTKATDDHQSRTDKINVRCVWCPGFEGPEGPEQAGGGDRCVARVQCKAEDGNRSSCWDPSMDLQENSAGGGRFPAALFARGVHWRWVFMTLLVLAPRSY